MTMRYRRADYNPIMTHQRKTMPTVAQLLQKFNMATTAPETKKKVYDTPLAGNVSWFQLLTLLAKCIEIYNCRFHRRSCRNRYFLPTARSFHLRGLLANVRLSQLLHTQQNVYFVPYTQAR